MSFLSKSTAEFYLYAGRSHVWPSVAGLVGWFERWVPTTSLIYRRLTVSTSTDDQPYLPTTDRIFEYRWLTLSTVVWLYLPMADPIYRRLTFSTDYRPLTIYRRLTLSTDNWPYLPTTDLIYYDDWSYLSTTGSTCQRLTLSTDDSIYDIVCFSSPIKEFDPSPQQTWHVFIFNRKPPFCPLTDRPLQQS